MCAIAGYFKSIPKWVDLGQKRVRAKSELPCGTCSGPKVTTGRCMYNQRASPAPSSGSLEHPCSQDDQLCPRQKLHPLFSTWTNREFTALPKKDSHFLFVPVAPLPLSNLSHVRPSRCFVAHKEPALQIHSSLIPSPTPSCLLNKG